MNRNSALIWLPKVEALGFPSPKTEVIPYDHGHLVAVMEGEESEHPDPLIGKIEAACSRIGYPCFLRTDLASAKHSGPEAYLIENSGSIPSRLFATVEDSELKFWIEQGPEALLVRQFLDLDAPFVAFRGLPISREWRFFADSEHVICAHPYWPEAALEDYVKGPDNWRELLAGLHERPADSRELSYMAICVANACGGRWSVDFAADRDGKWWLIDCAVMEDSWHWPGCKNATTP